MSNVFQPSSIIGNGNSLVTIGDNGEIMSYFYPAIDHSQNIKQGMVAIYSDNNLNWTYENNFNTEQHYLPKTNILITECNRADVSLKITDFMLEDEPIMVRHFIIKNVANCKRTGKIIQYLNIDIDDISNKNRDHIETLLKEISKVKVE